MLKLNYSRMLIKAMCSSLLMQMIKCAYSQTVTCRTEEISRGTYTDFTGSFCVFQNLNVTPESNINFVTNNKSRVGFQHSTIEYFSKRMFDSLLNIHTVNAEDNGIQKIYIPKTLLNLYVKDNRINSILIDETGESQLQKLVLWNNTLKDLTNLTRLVNLEVLDLDLNNLDFLDINVFAKMHKLTKLSLGQMNLMSLSFEASTIRLPALLYFEVYEGKLKYIEYEKLKVHFPSLTRTLIRGNNWDCSFLTRMTAFLRSSHINFGEEYCENGVSVEGICCK